MFLEKYLYFIIHLYVLVMSVKLKFKGKLMKTGNSWAVVVPKPYIDNGLIDPNKEYVFIIKNG